MNLNDNAKAFADYAIDVINKEKQEAYMKGYTAGYDKGAKDYCNSSVVLRGIAERLKDAPSAMDTMPVAPNPCVKNMTWKTVKDFLQKFNEEADEWKQEVLSHGDLADDVRDMKMHLDNAGEESEHFKRRLAEEAADVCTVLASFLEAVGIGYDIRMEEQAHVNRHNHERGRN